MACNVIFKSVESVWPSPWNGLLLNSVSLPFSLIIDASELSVGIPSTIVLSVFTSNVSSVTMAFLIVRTPLSLLSPDCINSTNPSSSPLSVADTVLSSINLIKPVEGISSSSGLSSIIYEVGNEVDEPGSHWMSV